jgi:hypothetical protein
LRQRQQLSRFRGVRPRYRPWPAASQSGTTPPASARSQLLGITKASLATDSWLSAAAAAEGAEPVLTGLTREEAERMLGGSVQSSSYAPEE